MSTFAQKLLLLSEGIHIPTLLNDHQAVEDYQCVDVKRVSTEKEHACSLNLLQIVKTQCAHSVTLHFSCQASSLTFFFSLSLSKIQSGGVLPEPRMH